MNEIKKLNTNQLVYDFGTTLFLSDGKRTTRLALQGEQDYKTKIAARSGFVNLTYFFDQLLSRLFGTHKKWIKVTLSVTTPSLLSHLVLLCRKIIHFISTRKWQDIAYIPKEQTVLLNVNSLCKRTTLSRKEVLGSTSDQLSARLAEPASILWNYSKLNNDLFPHVLFINLKTRTDRVESFKQHLKTIGADFKYDKLDAVIGTNLPSTAIEKISKSDGAKREQRDDRKGRLGCFMSHLSALKTAKANSWSEVLITEDDVRFIPNYFSSNYARRAKAELPNDWGMFFLGHYDAKKKQAKAFSDHLVQPGCPYDCHAYMVNATMYDSLINALEAELQKGAGEMRALDVVIGEDLTKMGKIFACKDNIAIQDEGISSIVGMEITGNYSKELQTFKRIFTPTMDVAKTRDGLPIMPAILAGTLYQMMHHIARLFDKYQIGYVIESGTALGAERHKGLIPHDDDIDLQIFPGEEKKLKDPELCKELEEAGLEIVDHWLGAKVCPIKDHPLGRQIYKDGYYFKSPNVDLFFSEEEIRDGETVHFYKNPMAKGFWPKLFIKKSEIFQQDGTVPKVPFGPVMVRAIAKQKEYCIRSYGSDCLGEAYLQYDHLREWGLTRKPIVMTDLAPPAYTEWNGIKSCLDLDRK